MRRDNDLVKIMTTILCSLLIPADCRYFIVFSEVNFDRRM